MTRCDDLACFLGTASYNSPPSPSPVTDPHGAVQMSRLGVKSPHVQTEISLFLPIIQHCPYYSQNFIRDI